MTKGRAKITTNSGSAPPRPRSLRTKKRECPDDEMTLSDNAQPILPPQDTEGNVATAAATPPSQCPTPQSPLQESTTSLTLEEQAEEESFPATQKSDTEEKYLVATSICAEHVMDKAVEGTVQGETLLTNPNNDSQLKDLKSIDNQGGEEQEEEIKTQESNRSPSHTPADQLRSTLPTSQEGDMGEESDQKEPNGVCMDDEKEREITKEAVMALPAKKKRRMGMCGLTEKERSNILQAQRRENGKNGTGGGERKSGNKMSDVVVIPSMSLSSSPLPIPATEQSNSEIKLQSGYYGREGRTEAVVHVAMTTSDVTNNVCNPFGQDPGCSEGETCQADPSVEPGPGQINDPGMDPAAETEGHRDNHSLIQEVEASADAGTTVEQYEKQRKEEEDGPGESDYHPTTDICENVGAEGDQTRTRDGRLGEMGGEAGGGAVADTGASTTDAGPQVCSYEEIRKAAVTPSGSEENGNCVPDDNPDTGPSPVSTEQPQTSDTTDSFGFGPLDYVTDSQLNSFFLIQEEEAAAAAMELDAGPGSRQEDATDLVCGLIRELSSLNRTVMAAHRELENLRRGSKVSRASIRRGSGPNH